MTPPRPRALTAPSRARAAWRRLLAPIGLAGATALGLLAISVVPPVSAAVRAATPLRASSSTSSSRSSAGKVSLAVGKTLFDQSCASCHGIEAQGSTLAPSLQDLGAGTIDLWVSSGWMPLAVPGAQPLRKTDRYTRAETIDIAQYVASLSGYRGFGIPKVGLAGTSVQKGFAIYAEICAACHTITGAGDALSAGITAPSLHSVTKAQVVEAMRTGPGNMPRFGPGILSNQQVKDVVAYVVKEIEHPAHPGGLFLGGVGPVAEGFIGLFAGVGLCILAAFWIGDRTPRHGDDAHPGAQNDDDGPAGEGEGREREVEHV